MKPNVHFMSKEIEKKYLVLGFIPNQIVDLKPQALCIEQIYLTDDPNGERRVRKTTLSGTSTEYVYTEKSSAGTSASREQSEQAIDLHKYNHLVAEQSNPLCKNIRKFRYVFTYKGHVFELDVYCDHLKELVTLEIEVANESEFANIILPPSLKLIDVTGDKRFSNRALAEHGIPAGVL